MSFYCEKHGWRHLLMSCPKCSRVTATASSSMPEPRDAELERLRAECWEAIDKLKSQGVKLREALQRIVDWAMEEPIGAQHTRDYKAMARAALEGKS